MNERVAEGGVSLVRVYPASTVLEGDPRLRLGASIERCTSLVPCYDRPFLLTYPCATPPVTAAAAVAYEVISTFSC